MTTNKPALVASWEAEERAPFSGWDFSHLAGRLTEETPPWDYAGRAAVLMRGARSALDLGTGGGERLLALRDSWPPLVIAAEDYAPNVRLAGQRLNVRGAQVIHVPVMDVAPLPLADGSIDLVLNRHSGMDISEVVRVLSPGGSLLTEQVHGLWAGDLQAVFDASPAWPEAVPERYLGRLARAGMDVVDSHEWQGRFSFTDVAAVVYYLGAVPWIVRGFAVRTHLDGLWRLQRRLEAGEPLAFKAWLYLIEARKP